jgi:uncharacterized membrane protein (UPF0182 family)
MRWRGFAIAAVIAAIVMTAGLILLGLCGDLLVDWAWFSSLGYLAVFRTVLATKAALFATAFLASIAVLWLNGWLAVRLADAQAHRPGFDWRSVNVGSVPELIEHLRRHLPWRRMIATMAALVAALIAMVQLDDWDIVLRFVHGVSYGQADPLFGRDIGFYLFVLPAWLALRNFLLVVLVATVALAGAVYWAHGDIDMDRRPRLSPVVVAHGSALLGLFFVVKAGSYWLDRYLLLYGDNGVVIGAGYTDLHVALPVLWVLMGLAAVAALMCWANWSVRTWRLPAAAATLVFASSFVVYELVPAVFQRVVVKPSELALEKPFIQRNIALTQEAYNLHQITVEPFPVEQGLTSKGLEANRATIDNIRLWDPGPLMDTYRQMQEIRTYYRFHDVDIDRYRLDSGYRAVTVSARELEPKLLPPNAQTWVNRHLLFTHGFGAVMSPVTLKSAEGLPEFYLQNIPPVATGGPPIGQPRIYFSERSDDYVVVKGSTPEFDYPNGKDNVYEDYGGRDGITFGGLPRRLLFAWYFADFNILLSSYVGPESRIMFRRNIRERVRTIAPFLTLDNDPYLVISDGRLFWIQDAYTTSSWFPYSAPVRNRGFNYIRNSVKVVVDAYEGTVDFYLADPADAIARTWQRIFPQLFKPLDAMPADLQRHIRYPEDLFHVQAQMYRAYHMDSAEVFYNREDLWQFPRQPEDATATMAPYYIIMRLPGEAQAEFFLMLPMVPSQRENMIAWLAARCDPPNYGKLIVYEFPKDKLVYGPFQIEALINQNTGISQQLSLWNQLGSRVIRGHLIVIPIDNTILYVSPLYLRAESGQLPELKRVIAAYGDRVAMEETLAEALAALFGQPAPAAPAAAPGVAAHPPPAGAAAGDHARLALEHYEQALQQLRTGDWSGFGAELDKMRSDLEALRSGKP